jgi:hypothetical protein
MASLFFACRAGSSFENCGIADGDAGLLILFRPTTKLVSNAVCFLGGKIV